MPPFACRFPNPSGSVAWWSDDFYPGEGKNLHIEGAVRERKAISKMYRMPLDFIMKERYMHLKIGFKDNGLITAIDDFSIADGGVEGSSSFGTSGDQSYGPYNTLKCPNISQRMEIVDSNRGKMYVSGQHCPFNWDSGTMVIYLIAEKLSKDPIEIARVNLHGPSSQNDPDPVPSFEACIEEGKKLMNWNWHRAGTKRLPDGRMHGMSFRYQMCPRHAFTWYESKLELRDGIVHMPTQGPLFGVFAVECNAMVVAEELGLEYDDISIDFDYKEKFTPVGGGADGTTASAWVTKECANILKRKILEAAIEEAEHPIVLSLFGSGQAKDPNPFKGLKPEELDLADGKVIIKSDPGKGIPIAQAVKGNLFANYAGMPPLALWTQGMGRKLDTMNTAYCEVAVDTETGEVEIVKLGVVADPGKIMRLTSLESQVDQVIYFSQGCQLLEDFCYDERTGVKLNANMIDYKMPTMLDVPVVDRYFLETRAGNVAYGANGISHSLANTHHIIIAIHNAIGVWVDPPATPDKVLKALGKA